MNTIYILKIEMVSKQLIENLSRFISHNNRVKVHQYKNPKDKLRTLMGELLIRMIASEVLCINHRDITIERNANGKPFLVNYPNFQFNISHSGDYVACLVGSNALGLDIEKNRIMDYESIAKEYFSLSEINYIGLTESTIINPRFFEIWTLRESFIKCYGAGLTIPLESFFVIPSHNTGMFRIAMTNRYMETISNQYYPELLSFEPGYAMAACSNDSAALYRKTKVSQLNLIDNFLG